MSDLAQVNISRLLALLADFVAALGEVNAPDAPAPGLAGLAGTVDDRLCPA